MNKKNALFYLSFFLTIPCFANNEGADALLNAIGGGNSQTPTTAENKVNSNPVQNDAQWKIKTALDRQIFTDFNSLQNPSFEMRQWVQFYFTEKYENFAHLWESLKDKTPDSFKASSMAAYLYSLNQLSIPETFFHEWMNALQNQKFIESLPAHALEETLATQSFDSWLMNSEIQITEAEKQMIQKIGFQRSPVFLSLNASLLRRKGELALELLPKLLENSPFRPLLAQTAVVALAKKGDLATAAKILKQYYEPFLKSSKDPKKLATHYLSIARLLYQAGALEGAIEYYEKIPNGIPEYLTAREELTWCWLRTGNISKLRGNLETLTSKVLEKEFKPEAYLVRAVSNLKFCYYSEVKKDFDEFVRVNQTFAKEIDTQLNAAEAQPPRRLDIYTQASLRSVDRKKEELQKLKEFSERSMSAVIPAVGIQKNWVNYTKDMEISLQSASKKIHEEYRRQWKNDKITLDEAIRKMQFVKVELLSQVSEAVTQMNGNNDSLPTTLSSANRSEGEKSKLMTDSKNSMIFPFDGVIWSDEFFKLQSVSKGQCIGQ